MTDISSRDSRKVKRIRFSARILILCWVGLWGFFLVGSLLFESFQTTDFIPMAIYLLFFLIPVFIAWRWEKIGGILFLLEGLIVLIGYPLLTMGASFSIFEVLMFCLTIAFPPLIAGLLFFICGRKARVVANIPRE